MSESLYVFDSLYVIFHLYVIIWFYFQYGWSLDPVGALFVTMALTMLFGYIGYQGYQWILWLIDRRITHFIQEKKRRLSIESL
jgi:hypothetical protein